MLRNSTNIDRISEETVAAKDAVGHLPWSFMGLLLALSVLYARPIFAWIELAREGELYSHIVLIPFVSAYLLWGKRQLFRSVCPGRLFWKVVPLGAGLATVVFLNSSLARAWDLPKQDWVSLTMASYLVLLVASAAAFYGGWRLYSVALPIAFLFFAVPLPTGWESALEEWSQHGSAFAAESMIQLERTPVVRDGLILHLPSISIQVAPECSGIRSSLVLLITSVLAGYLLLRSPNRRLALTLFVIPLGILRNGFRIFVICELCEHVSPKMIDSWIHHKGGPVFFVLSLVPFFLFLAWLRRSEVGATEDKADSQESFENHNVH